MSLASLIINVSNREQTHSNGLSGTWRVPPKTENQDFALLVVYPTPEIQDIGDERRVMHWLKSRPLAMDIVGLRSDAAGHTPGRPGTKEKWGLLLCEAEPDLPKELLKLLEDEIEFLNENPPDVKMRKDNKTKAIVAINIEPESIKKQKEEMSLAVFKARAQFEKECRRLVTKQEMLKAKSNLITECQFLVAEGDRMWARPAEQQNINELNRWACVVLGQERPWNYIPQQLVDCPGCGTKIKENILQCPACHGWLEEGIENLLAMTARQRKAKMYPETVELPPSQVK